MRILASLMLLCLSLAACSRSSDCLPYDGSCSPLTTLVMFDRGVKYMFVAATSPNAAYGGVTGADAFCASGKPADLPGAGSDYKALLLSSTRNQSTGWVLAVGGEYRRADGTLIGRTNAARVFVFPLTNPVQDVGINIRTGATVTDENTWATGLNCSDWTAFIASAESGLSSATTLEMMRKNVLSTTSCAGAESIYCVQQ
jgi:hypothetical protein